MKSVLRLLAALMLLSGISAFAAGHAVNGTFVDSADKAANPSLTYNVYRATGACPASGLPTGATKITNATTNAFSDTNVSVGQTYCYYVTAAINSGESVGSNDAAGTIPIAPVTSFTINVQ